tara:strand:- start:121 stop:345 length:225 start_codon:yes stop_codon:yes gene_type:complete
MGFDLKGEHLLPITDASYDFPLDLPEDDWEDAMFERPLLRADELEIALEDIIRDSDKAVRAYKKVHNVHNVLYD